MRAALIEESFRIFSLVTTRAVCPTLRRLGTLVSQEVPCAWTGVAVAATPEVGVDAAAAMVGVGEAGALVGVSAGNKVAVAVGGAGDGLESSAVFDARTASVMTSVALGTIVFSTRAGEAAFVAHPRRSMRIRITTRMAVTTDLNRL